MFSVRPRALIMGVAAALMMTSVWSGGPAQAETTAPPLMITEIAPDNTGSDEYEYFEIHNTTDAAINLAEQKYSFAYTYADSDDRSQDKQLTVDDANLTLSPGETIIMWLSYTAKNLDSFARTDADFRTNWSMSNTARIVRITGQAGMANKGERGIRVLKDGQIESWSYYPAGSVGANKVAEFAVSDTQSMTLLASQATATPGTVRDEQFVRTSQPDPGDQSGQPDPDDPTSAQDAPDTAAPLMITELVPDTDNVSGSDGYEFIEIANTTDQPIDFSNYTLSYLYPDSKSSALWPSTPDNVVIQPGKTLVFWIRNGNNNDLGAADFNKQWGTSLTMGQDLVEIHSGGMANGGARGMQIQTNTGTVINRAYYNMNGKEVEYNKGFHFCVNTDDLTTQGRIGTHPASPGTLMAAQLPRPLVALAADTQEPALTDATPSTVRADQPLTFDFTITDNTSVKTVTLNMKSSADQDSRAINLTHDSEDVTHFTFEVPAADMTGKRWFDYTLTYTDGTFTKTTAPVRVAIQGATTDPLRINHADNDWVSGTTDLIAATDAPSSITMTIDGTNVLTEASLEGEPVFAFEATQTDTFFRNGVLAPNGDILTIFDEGTYSEITTISTPVPLVYMDGQTVTASIYAGTKAKPGIDENENNDDFDVRALRLILPDGRTLTPRGYSDATQWLRMGDSTGKHDFFDATFDIPDDAFTGARHAWDTTTAIDGTHTITAQATVDGTQHNVTRVLRVDNTAPVIETHIDEGALLQGDITVNPTATDSGIGLDSLSATLDGKDITLPLTTSSTTLPAGNHELTVIAVDKLGNSATVTTHFTTPVEDPTVATFTPGDGARVEAGDVVLSAHVDDEAGDQVTAKFYEGDRVDNSTIRTASGTVNDAAQAERESARPLTSDEIEQLAQNDDVVKQVTSDDAFPYELFEIPVSDSDAGSTVRVHWSGQAERNAQVSMRVRAADGSWDEVDRHITGPGTDSASTRAASAADGAYEKFDLDALVKTDTYAHDGVITVLIQHSDGWAGKNLTTRESTVTPAHADDEARSTYDFTLAWESDTQYYNERDDYYPHQLAIHQYLLDQRANMNIQYLFHTGDIIDDFDQQHQWDRANPAYRTLDEAGFPYGVLAGNHDVGHLANDYSEYSKNFGEARFAANPWYGGSYEDNRGHFDLFSAGGIDFIAVYQGWGPGDAEIEWMNQVLAAHPDRIAIIDLHEFMLTTGGLGPIPQRILDEVVATNPNVRMVMSGHYHDAFTRTDSFDDDGDGVAERTVTSMLFDYQALPEGGQGYLRLLHFDNEGQRMMVRTYSPSLQRYNSDDQGLLGSSDNPYEYQHFDVSYAQLGITPSQRVLSTDTFSADVLSTRLIGTAEGVATPGTASATWKDVPVGTQSWYVVVSDVNGGEVISPVLTFTAVPVGEPTEPGTQPTEPGTDQNRGHGQSAQPGASPNVSAGGRHLSATGADGGLLAAVSVIGMAGAVMVATRRRRHTH